MSDYVSRTETVTYAPGQTMAFVTFSTRDDEIVEGNEMFTVTLNVPAEAASLGVRTKSPSVAVITIIDDSDGKICTQQTMFKPLLFIYVYRNHYKI